MKVKIVKYSKDYCWYKDRVGEVFEVNNHKFNDDYYEIENRYNCIYKADAIPVNEIKYDYRGINIITKCPAGFSQMVGSATCDRCEYSCGSNTKSRIVLCSWQKEEEDKMDLKSIAVRFENVEQREEIEAIFKKEGYGVYVVNDQFRFPQGHLGVSEVDNVVYNFTHHNKKEKIISYEEFVGGNMKRLDIRKEYEDDMITIRIYPKHIYICIGCMAEVRVGKAEHRASLSQANAILKVLGLPYVLYEGVDWNKVEEGTDVQVTTEINKFNAKFHSYVSNLKKVIVIVGESVRAIDEDKVELNR